MGTFEDLYRQHVQAVFRFAYRLTGDRSTAEDVTSEAFLALYRNLSSIDESLLPGWLLTVARNRVRDLWRRRSIEQRFLEQMDGPAATPSAGIEEWLLGCRDLKPVHRTCVMLRYVYGMTRAEIANTTGLSETQVKGYLQYGLKLLREAYRPSSKREK
jgi:RNA polymerase sigma-70 factor, ECF subfamily